MRNRTFTLLGVLALSLAALMPSAFGATYYVATTGSDSSPGTLAQPWLTLQKAVNTIANGDTAVVLPGTYAGCRIESSGASAAPKTIMAQTPGTVVLNALGPSNRHNRIFEIENYDFAVNYWVVDGFTVNGANTIGGIDARSVDVQMNSNITIQNCTVHNAKNGASVCTGIFSAFTNNVLIQNNTSYSNAEHGCYVNNSSDNGVVRSNVFYSNFSLGLHMNGDASMGGDGQMTGWIVEKNKCYSNGSNGFDGDGVSSSIWRNNLAYDNVSKGIHLTQVDGTSNPSNDKVYNNTLIVAVGGFYCLNFMQGASATGGANNSVMNNILYNYATSNSMRGGLMYVGSWMSTLTSDYNVVVDRFALDDNATNYTLAQWRSAFGKDMHSVVCLDANALFVDQANKDFHLKVGSPAVDAGTTLSDVTDDKDGNSRPQGMAYDAGCYELLQSTELRVTTTSLPGGYGGVAYSQTLAAIGGTAPYSWSVAGGALPSGLSLAGSTGVISGTPTGTGASNFTVRVTDSQGTPDTADQALSIAVDTPSTYEFAASDGETSTTSTAWQTKATLTFTPAVADDWLIFAFAEVKGSSTSYSALARLTLDGAGVSDVIMMPTNAAVYATFTALRPETLTATAHTLTLDYRSSSASGTAWIRNARIVAIRKGTLEMTSALANATVALTTTMTDYGTLSFTPATAGDYLLIWSGEVSANTAYSTSVEARYKGAVWDGCTVRSKANTDWFSFMSFGQVSADTTAQTITIAAAKQSGSAATHSIRRARLAAIRVSDGRFANSAAAAADSESTTASTAFQQKLTASWNVTAAGKWLILASCRLAESSLSYNVEGRVQVDDTTTSGQPLYYPKDTSDYLNAAAIDVRDLGTGTRYADVDYRSSNAAGTAKIRYARLMALPLEGGAGPADLVITTVSMPDGRIGAAYSQALAATGGTAPYSWSMNGGSLPAGLSLSSGGVISGTPTTGGASNFTVRVADSQGVPDTDDQALSIVIPADLVVATASLPGGQVGAAYSQTLAATGGVTPYSWSLSSGSLPAGLSLSSGGVISGTPTTVGAASFTVQASDSQTPADTATRALSIVVAPAALAITTTSLSAGQVGVGYSDTLAATGGTAPYSWSIVSGGLPAGLSLSSSTGAITGTPSTEATASFTARVTDGLSATDDQALSITIGPASAGSTYESAASDGESSTTSTAWQTKTTLTFTPAVTDDWLIFGFAELRGSSTSYSALARLTVDGAGVSDVITMPTNTSVYATFTALRPETLTAAAHTLTLDYRSSSASGTAWIRNARVVAIRRAALEMVSASSNATVALTTTMTDYGTLSFTPATAGDYLLIWSGEVSANTAYSTSMEARCNGAAWDGCTVRSKANTDWFSFMSFGQVSADTTAQTITIAAAKDAGSAATHNIRRARLAAIRVSDGRFAYSAAASSDGESTTASTAFQQKLTASWNVTAAGNWLVLGSCRLANSSTSYGVEARVQVDDATTSAQPLRVPAIATDYMNAAAIDVRSCATGTRYADMDYRSTNAAGTAKVKYARLMALPLDGGAGPADLVITTASLPGGQIGAAYSQALTATGGVTPYGWSLNGGSLPAGLSLSSGGVISGTPTTAGTSNFTVRVADSLGVPDTDDQALSIVIPADLVVATASLPGGQVGAAYSQTLAATGGVTPYSWSLSSGSLPAGLSLSSGGVISGTPTTAGTSNLTVRATDSQTPADTATRALSIVVAPATLAITTASLPDGQAGVGYNQSLAATGGTAPYGWSILSGSLPAGLSLSSSTGAITGTPSTEATASFTARVTDGLSATDDQALSITIGPMSVGPTYEFVASDGESSTTSTAWQTKATLTFTPAVADDWLIFGFAELKGSSTSYNVLARLTVDGAGVSDVIMMPTNAAVYATFTALRPETLTATAHTLTLDYRSSNAAGTARIRNARIVAIRKDMLEMTSVSSNATVALTTTMTDYATLSWTPATSGDYLLIWSAEASANTAYSTSMEARYNGGAYDSSLVESKANAEYFSFMSFAMATCPASVQTMTIAAAKEAGSAATHNIRRARLAAIRLTGGRLANYRGKSSDAQSTTTSTTFQNKLTDSWSVGTTGNWLILTSFRFAESSLIYNVEGRVQLDDAITMGQPLRRSKDTTDYMNAGTMDVRNLAAGTRLVDIDYRSSNAASTARIRYARFYALPLD